jgi:hypothetical protein
MKNSLHARRKNHTTTRITSIVPTTPIPNIVPPLESVGHYSQPYKHDGARSLLSSEQNDTKQSIWRPAFERLLSVLVAVTGLRIGEVLALRWINVDFGKGLVGASHRPAGAVYQTECAESGEQVTARVISVESEELQFLRCSEETTNTQMTPFISP